MKRLFLLVFGLVVGFGSLSAQLRDTFTVSCGPQFANDVYWSSATSDSGTVVPRTTWDLAFSINQTSGIRANHSAGVEVYKTDLTVADWSTLDTTGNLSSWSRAYNRTDDYLFGALNYGADFAANNVGWGEYDFITHVVSGDTLWVIKDRDDNWHQLVVEKRQSGQYFLRWGDLGGSNEKRDTLQALGLATPQLFLYLSLDTANGGFLREPSRDDWHFQFTYYAQEFNFGPGQPPVYYPSGGVMINPQLSVAEIRNMPFDEVTKDDGNFVDPTPYDIIGADWKRFDLNNSVYVYEDSLSFVVQYPNGAVAKYTFIEYGGSSTGEFTFVEETLVTVSAEEGTEQANWANVYPNPASDHVLITVDPSQGSEVNVSLRSISGQSVLNRRVATQGFSAYRLELPQLSPGVYFLELTAGSDRSFQRLVIR